MATDIYIINPSGSIQNGLVVVLPQPGQIGKAGVTNQGSGGFVLSYPTGNPEDRVQTVLTADQAQMQSGYRFRGEIRKEAIPMSNQDTANGVGSDITLYYPPAGAGFSHVIEGVNYGYNRAPSGNPDFMIQDGSGNIVFRQSVIAAGTNEVRFQPEKRGTANTGLFLVLTNGGLGVSGDISVLGHWLV